MKPEFSKEDKEILISAQEVLENFDNVYLSSLKKQGVKSKDAKRLLFDNKERQQLLVSIGDLISTMTPVYVFDKDEHVCEFNTAFGHDQCLICGKQV